MPRVSRKASEIRPGERLVALHGVTEVATGRDSVRLRFTDGGSMDFDPDAGLTVEIDPPGTPEELDTWTKQAIADWAGGAGVNVSMSWTKDEMIKAVIG